MKRVVEEQRLGFVATVCPEARGSRVDAFREIVVVRVQRAQPIDSPAYDLGLTEDEVRGRWERYFQALRAGQTASPADE